jgi:hypothetical protein
MRYPLFITGAPMLETLLRLLEELPDWGVYREVAAFLDGAELLAWRRLYESRPDRSVLLREAVRILSAEARKQNLTKYEVLSTPGQGTGSGDPLK